MFTCHSVPPTRILLADDQPEVRAALRLLFEQDDALTVVGELSRADIAAAWIVSLRPDVVLLDWELPGAQQLITSVRAACPDAQIIALSSLPESEADAWNGGADGFISKGDPPERLLAVVCALIAEPCL